MSAVLWHDLECGSYREDLFLWRELTAEHGGPVLDVGAGTGRVTLELARDGHEVSALDRDVELLEELRARAGALPVEIEPGDARNFQLRRRFRLCLVPMQTIQLLGGPQGRAGFLRCAAAHLLPGAVAAVAISERLEPFTPAPGQPLPLPDMCEREGLVLLSQPTAVRAGADGFTLERRREVVDLAGEHTITTDHVHLDLLTAAQLEREAALAGLQPLGRREIPATEDYVGSTVVILGA